MKKIVLILNYFVFAAVTLTIMGIVYEGFALEWFPSTPARHGVSYRRGVM